MNTQNIILQFLTGKVDVTTFSDALYNDSDLEELLRDPSLTWHDSFIGKYGDIFDYLIKLNYSRLGDIVNAIGVLELFLKKKEFTGVTIDQTYYNLHGLMLDSMPGYLNMDINVNSTFFQNQISSIIEKEITKAEKKKQIREKFKSLFQYQSKPPRWIQSPEWLMKDDLPLFFVGQVELKHDSFHDNGAVYIFLDTASGGIETVQQFY